METKKQFEFDKQEMIYFFEKLKNDINKTKDKILYIEFKEFFAAFPYFGEKILDDTKGCQDLLSSCASYWREDGEKITIIFNNPFAHKVNISEIRNEHLGKLLQMEVYVKYKSNVYARRADEGYYCKECPKRFQFRPQICFSCKGKRFYQKDVFEDVATLFVEEDPQSIHFESRPQTIRAYINPNLIGRYRELNLGSKLTLYAIPFLEEVKKTHEFRLELYNFEAQDDGIEKIELTEKDKEFIKKEIATENFFQDASNSLFKEVYGLQEIKDAILLQLISSPKEKTERFVRNRGNLMILIVGSPGVAKSVFLKKVSSFFPRSRYMSCSMATSIGLVASARKDELTGTYILEPGAIPLCHKGGCAVIDELDKIKNEEDYGHLNTMMDSLKIIVDKANIHTELPADVSILASMNPKYKVFEKNDNFYTQIKLPKDLTDRFDLIFCIDSKFNQEVQDRITDRILSPVEELEQKYSDDFLLKYISYCRSFQPKLGKDAKDYIAEKYKLLMRNSVENENTRSSPRIIGNILRLSGAYARSRLGENIETEDCRKAFNLIVYSLKNLGFVREINGVQVLDFSKIEDIPKQTTLDKVDVIKKILSAAPGKILNIEDLKEQCNFADFDKILFKLKQAGDIFEPRNHLVQLNN